MNRQAVISLESPLAGRFVNDAPEIAGNAPDKLPAVKLVSADPLSAGKVDGNLASAIVPEQLLMQDFHQPYLHLMDQHLLT